MTSFCEVRGSLKPREWACVKAYVEASFLPKHKTHVAIAAFDEASRELAFMAENRRQMYLAEAEAAIRSEVDFDYTDS